MARPHRRYAKRSAKVIEEVLARVSCGETLTSACRALGFDRNTWYDWMKADEALAVRFARARDLGFDAIAESTFEIADDGQNDWMEKLGQDGQPIGWQLNGEHIQRSKLRVWTRLQLLSKWSPRYRETVKSEVSGPDGGPVQLDDTAREARVLAIIAAASARKEGDGGS